MTASAASSAWLGFLSGLELSWLLAYRDWPRQLSSVPHGSCAPTGFVAQSFSHSVLSNSLRPHGLQHTRLPCPLPSPRGCSDSHPLSSDAIQPSRLLSSPSPPTLNLSQHHSLSNESPLQASLDLFSWKLNRNLINGRTSRPSLKPAGNQHSSIISTVLG